MIWQDLPVRAVWHAVFHIAVPLLTAQIFYKGRRLQAALILLAGLLIDLDHLFASPIYAPGRCSIGFHPLHTLPAIAIYAGMLYPAKTRIFAIGLLIHIALDLIDCWWMRGV